VRDRADIGIDGDAAIEDGPAGAGFVADLADQFEVYLDRVGAGIGPDARGRFDRANQADEAGLSGRNGNQLADIP
jgi:hypothetical protein